jgi:hypothetical protein
MSCTSYPVLYSTTSLSFWGGIDPHTGIIIDTSHPLVGQCVTNTALCIPSGRGSCTGSQVLLELILKPKLTIDQTKRKKNRNSRCVKKMLDLGNIDPYSQPNQTLLRLCRLFFGLTSNIPKQSNYVNSVPADTNKTFHHGALLAFLPILCRVSRTNPLAESLIWSGKIHRIRVLKLQVVFIWHRHPLVLRKYYYSEQHNYLSKSVSLYRFRGAYYIDNNIIWGGEIHHMYR